MFTGIVKDIGKIKRISKKSDFWEFQVESGLISSQVGLGDSVAVNGVCLTVKKKERETFFCDAIQETLKVSNLKRLKAGDYINLEPSLELGQRLDGHFVLGHVDTETRLINLRKLRENIKLTLRVPKGFSKYVVSKGSITIEGMSLTVAEFKNNVIEVNIIPYTWEKTNLKYKKSSSYVNVEFDYLAKIVQAK